MNPQSTSRVWPLVGFLVGVLVLLAGVLVSYSVVGGGVDFPVMYVMGKGWLEGTNVYLPEQTAAFRAQYGVDQYGMFYPPATGFTMLPLALLPYPVAKWTWFVIIELSLILGIRALVRLAAPRARDHVWMICAGIVLASSSLRWGLMLLQAAPFVLALLCFMVVALHTDRPRLALAVAILATAMKVTLGVPFLALLALHRRLRAVAVCLGSWAALNVLGFLRMGAGSLAEYRRNVAHLETIGHISSPDPWRPIALPRLDWVYLFYGVTGSLSVSRIASLATSALVFGLLLREGLRVRTPP